MKIILQKDVPSLGKKGDVKNVSDGYARNYLFKNSLAVAPTKEALNILEQQKSSDQQKKEKELAHLRELVKKLNSLSLRATLKIGGERSVFGSIGAAKIASLLEVNGLRVKKSDIALEHPIKTLGERKIKIKLEHGFEAEISLKIEKEQ